MKEFLTTKSVALAATATNQPETIMPEESPQPEP